MHLDTHELAWAAGFFDGEGYVGFRRLKREFGMRINQIDPVVLERFRDAVQCGNVRGPYSRIDRPRSKPYWLWELTGHARMQFVVGLLWPWLSPVKRQQATTAVEAWRTSKQRLTLVSS